MPPRPPRLPFYRNAGGAGEKPAPQAVIWWQASRRGQRVRSAGSGRRGQPPGAHHCGPRARSSSPQPGHTGTHAPASSARRPTAAPPAPRPSPPRRRDRQSAGPPGRFQDHGREPHAGSAWPPCRSRSSPLAASWSTATTLLAGRLPAPRSAGVAAWLSLTHVAWRPAGGWSARRALPEGRGVQRRAVCSLLAHEQPVYV